MASDQLHYPRLPSNPTTPFKTKTTALLFLRALNSDVDFQLATDVLGAGAFNDLVLRVHDHDDRVVTLFLHLEHTERHLVYRQSLTGVKATLPLAKFFKSYQEIKDSMSSAQRGPMFDGKLEDCRFLAYTNARGDADLGDVQSVTGCQEELVWSGRGSLHGFDPAKDTDLWQCVKEGGGDARRFLSQFRLFSGQPGVGELEGLIKDELRKVEDGKFSGFDLDRLAECFVGNVKAWLERDNIVLDKHSDLLEKSRQTLMCSKFARK